MNKHMHTMTIGMGEGLEFAGEQRGVYGITGLEGEKGRRNVFQL